MKLIHYFVATMFILIGLLHLQVHYADLVTPELEEQFSQVDQLVIMETPADAYRNWQGFSFMMGVCFVVIGLLNISMARLAQNQIPRGFTFSMMLLMASVSYAGYHFFTPFQLYGGIFGLSLLTLGFLYSFRDKASS